MKKKDKLTFAVCLAAFGVILGVAIQRIYIKEYGDASFCFLCLALMVGGLVDNWPSTPKPPVDPHPEHQMD